MARSNGDNRLPPALRCRLPDVTDNGRSRKLSVVLFDDFELLDVFGPLELFGTLGDHFEICLVGPADEPVRSAQGPSVLANCSYENAALADIVFVPGGIGTRSLALDPSFCSWLSQLSSSAEIVASVCTGSGLLAAAGLLDGYYATSNKRAFTWAMEQGPRVKWVSKARWVEDRNRWTSAGVAAGMDMTLALIARMFSEELARELANRVEYDWHVDPTWDPFAVINGLALD